MKDNLFNIGMMYMSRNATQRVKELNKLNVTDKNFYLLCNKGSSKQVEDALTLLHISPCYNYSKCLTSAVEGGKIDNIKVLIKDNRINPTSLSYNAIVVAIKRGYTDIFYLLKEYIKNYIVENNGDVYTFYTYFLRKVVNMKE